MIVQGTAILKRNKVFEKLKKKNSPIYVQPIATKLGIIRGFFLPWAEQPLPQLIAG